LVITTAIPGAGLPSGKVTFPDNVPFEDWADNADAQPAMISAVNQRLSFVKLDDMVDSLTDRQGQFLTVLFSTDFRDSQILLNPPNINLR
jgi:hypothetical protein